MREQWRWKPLLANGSRPPAKASIHVKREGIEQTEHEQTRQSGCKELELGGPRILNNNRQKFIFATFVMQSIGECLQEICGIQLNQMGPVAR
jgi:hypothetical protein